MAKPGLWDQPDSAREITRRIKLVRQLRESWGRLNERLEELSVLRDLLKDEGAGDAELEKEFADKIDRFRKDLDHYELTTLLDGEFDPGDAILTIHSGAGGTESCDWAEMLLRMYLRWTERQGYETQVLDIQPGEEAGIKDATVEVRGAYAFGYLKAESGVHRLVRISPFDAGKRRHTSFASVFVYPDVDADVDVEINESDLRIDTYRASGAGGQHVNKTDSAVRITHLPTNIVVQCQSERSQHRNRDSAMRILRARLHHHQLEEERKKREAVEASKKDIAWGSQIRSYVFHPYSMVKDHRTNEEMGNVQAVMDGELDPFIHAWLRSAAARESGEQISK
ncbi:MAG: peptide chain release factor 2 [Candidatus Eisenbacteria bacterium]|nr:peptide chain release factor 2 [Candidatus Eisenbacteria bacterium]